MLEFFLELKYPRKDVVMSWEQLDFVDVESGREAVSQLVSLRLVVHLESVQVSTASQLELDARHSLLSHSPLTPRAFLGPGPWKLQVVEGLFDLDSLRIFPPCQMKKFFDFLYFLRHFASDEQGKDLKNEKGDWKK